MRIAVTTPTFLPIVGGAELGIHEIYRRLGRKHDVIVLTPHLPHRLLAGYGAHDYRPDNYLVHHIAPQPHSPFSRFASKVVKRTSLPYSRALSKLAGVDIVNFHFMSPQGGAVLLMKYLYNTPTALSLVGRSDVLRLLPPPQRFYAKRLIEQADVVLPNSTYYLGDWLPSTPVQVIPYGVDTAEFSPTRHNTQLRHDLDLSTEHFVVLAVQRLAPVKRVDVLIHVMAAVVRRDPRVVLVIGGKGEEESALRILVSALGLEANVRFAGYIDSARLPEYFASADAFVFHSLVETFGIVFAQAMASGLPIVAANTSCVPDVLSSENGFLVAPFDLSAFADAILTLASNSMLAAQIASHNRARAVDEFDWEIIASRYEAALLATIATFREGQGRRVQA